MLPVIALVGRPNVGKSTLFNCLTKSRDALVVDLPGVTRDRQYGEGKLGAKPYIVIDTGGITSTAAGLDEKMLEQSRKAIEEADYVLFLVDAKAGRTPEDELIAKELRQRGKVCYLIINKVDGLDENTATLDFYKLGFDHIKPIAASHGRGVTQLMEKLCENFPAALPSEDHETGIKVAIVGKPNVGKSTLINRMLGEERVVVFDQPGTTRDSIFLPLERRGQRYTLIDTAGVRRKGKIHETVEKFSVVKTLQAIQAAHVVVFVIDARENVSEHDLHLLGYVLDTGRAIVLAVNKWDGLSAEVRTDVKAELSRRLSFVDYARIQFISALHGTGVGDLYDWINEAYRSAMVDMSTQRLTALLEQAVQEAQPPLVSGRRIKLRYAHPGGHNPPVIVIHGNQTSKLPGHYKRYLANFFRDKLKLKGTPLQLNFKTGDNPFKDKRSNATPRQRYQQKRDKK